MKHKMKAFGLLTASAAVMGVLFAPATLAAEKHASATSCNVAKHGHKTKHKHACPPQAVSGFANHRDHALESKVQALQDELQYLKSEIANRPVAGSGVQAAKVQELDEWMNSVKSEPKTHGKNHMVFFRAGGLRMDALRGGTLNGLSQTAIGTQDGWYFGAGFDWSLADDLFGAMRGTEVMAELMFDYKQLGSRTYINGLPGSNLATVNALTLAASPKIKFLKGQSFRPWLIPVGFEINVISPPSNAVTVLNPGMQSGIGVDYNLWKNIYVGADGRYHYSTGSLDGVNTNGFTFGGYVGVGF